jgi:glycosyltransferase involved in cell wall biosynthesis
VAGDAALLVNPESVDELAEALRQMIADDRLREHFRQKGLARAPAFSWPRAVEKTWNVYRELI